MWHCGKLVLYAKVLHFQRIPNRNHVDVGAYVLKCNIKWTGGGNESATAVNGARAKDLFSSASSLQYRTCKKQLLKVKVLSNTNLNPDLL